MGYPGGREQQEQDLVLHAAGHLPGWHGARLRTVQNCQWADLSDPGADPGLGRLVHAARHVRRLQGDTDKQGGRRESGLDMVSDPADPRVDTSRAETPTG